jgi:hypothetical protein
MSTEMYVNRVSHNFVQDELNKLEPVAPPRVDIDKPELAVDVLQYGTPNPPETRKKGFDPGDPQTEQSDKLLEQDPEALKQSWSNLTKTSGVRIGIGSDVPMEDALGQLRAIVGGDDLKVFRSQVIRALKHLGVDTKKFFGE